MIATVEPSESSPHRRRPIATSAWFLLLAVLVVSFGVLASRPAAPANLGAPSGDIAAAKQSIDALTQPSQSAAAIHLLPADFTQVTGTIVGTKAAPDGTVRTVNVAGGCSAPWGEDNTRWDYGVPCMAHDLGYDLLRYAEKKGHPLPQDSRAALDNRLSTDMHATCAINPRDSANTCHLVASIYTAGFDVNSWHQRWGPPTGEPIGPMLIGVAVIGILLTFRLRGWLRRHRAAQATRPARRRPSVRHPIGSGTTGWARLGVASMMLLVLGESGIALARWAGASPSRLWPLTWVTQFAVVFFFAGGHANAASWRQVRAAGGGYRQYLASRAGWLLRPALSFAVVAFTVPVALELLGVSQNVNDTVVGIALHPLWLLGVYLLTVIVTPLMVLITDHAHTSLASGATFAVPLGLTVFADLAANWWRLPVLGYAAAFGVALLAQQAALLHDRHGTLPRAALAAVAGIGGTSMVLLAVFAPNSRHLLGAPGTLPALAGPTLPILLLGAVQLSLLGLAMTPLRALARRRGVRATLTFMLRAPMSLYLAGLAGMLLLVAMVELREPLVQVLTWLAGPRPLFAIALLAAPAIVVFRWFERAGPAGRHSHRPEQDDGVGTLLARTAATLGVGYAALGVFGLALTRFADGATKATVLGISLDPIQNLIHLLLGALLLHAVQTGKSATPSTWLLTAAATVPPLLIASETTSASSTGVALHALTGLLAIAGSVLSFVTDRTGARAAAV